MNIFAYIKKNIFKERVINVFVIIKGIKHLKINTWQIS